MCSKCENVLIGFSIPHPVSNCPLLHSSYCSVCCSYGHLTQDCPDQEVLKFRKPTYLEQLIPFSMLRNYKITSKTSLSPQEPPEDFLCPISQEVMITPVIACQEGHCFEKSSLEQWLKTRKSCPVCRCAIDSSDIKLNRYLRSEIDYWRQSTAEVPEFPKPEPLLEVEDSDRAIRQVLMNYSIQPSGRMKENRRLLKQLSDEIGRKLVYLKPQ